MFHSYYNVSKLRMDLLLTTLKIKLCCPFCKLYFRRGVSFNVHRTSHIYNNVASIIFSSPFLYLICCNKQGGDGKQDIMIDRCYTQNVHVSSAYTNAEGNWFVEGPSKPSGPSIENETSIYLLYNDRCQFASQNALTGHCKVIYIQSGRKFNSPFLYPKCHRCSTADCIITSTCSWSSHKSDTLVSAMPQFPPVLATNGHTQLH